MTITLAKLEQVEHVVLLGAGREGRSTYHYLRQHYPKLAITIADQNSPDTWPADFRDHMMTDELVTLSTGADYLQCLSTAALIFKSPGIPPHIPQLQAAERAGALVSSNTQLFFELTPQHLRIGITGTKGKSTTTALIHHVLQQMGKSVHLLGNIGTAPLSVLQDDINPDAIFVIELSSYQLYDLRQSPQMAVLQNIVPEHLTWHGDFAAYVDAKTNITRFQASSDVLYFNADDDLPRSIAAQTSALSVPFGLTGGRCTVAEDAIVLDGQPVMKLRDIPLHGRFNLLNVLPAMLVADAMGMERSTLVEAVRTFIPLQHRLQHVATIADVDYYNDSLATVPEAAIAAIEGFRPRAVVLIAGGYDRELTYDALAQRLLIENIRHLVLFPTTGERILTAMKALSGSIPGYDRATDMQAAVSIAASYAKPGDVVLLSPASASFNLFRDYQDRGEQFIRAVRALQQ